jgi:hypothetical protein
VSVNPPWFTWVPVGRPRAYELEIRSDGTTGAVVVRAATPFCLYTPETVLAAGEYVWRVRARFDEKGSSATQWNRPRRFKVTAEAPQVPRPPLERVYAAIPTTHPRLLVAAGDVAALRRSRATHPEWYQALVHEADSLLTAPLMEEPRPWSGGKWNAAEWLNYYGQIVRAAHCTETLAFACLVSGRDDYGEAARRWLMRFASWDPHGTTSLRVNDEQTMHIMFAGARAYTWLYDRLTTGEREQVRAMLAARARDAFRLLAHSSTPFEQFPYNSHNGRLWHFLGEVAIALYGDVPEAREWLDYAITVYYGWYPIWGGDDGGWAEGLHYFITYQEYAFHWVWELEKVLHIPASRKPFYSRAGDYLIAVAPPGAAVSGFGDFSENGPPPRRAWIAATLAAFIGNPHWEWLAEQVGLRTSELTPLRYLVATSPRPRPEAPPASPRLRVLPATGLATYQSALSNPKSNVQWMMRVSPLGNLSHSHCDQLALVAGAFGDPIFVNTGFRDYYGSPFCRDWYWHTRSHNAVLVGGQGQGRSMSARATLLGSGEDGRHAWVWGDATPAYAGHASRVRRAVACVPVDNAQLLCVLDDVETTAADIDVLWHTRVQPDLRAEAGVFEFQTTAARVSARAFSAQPLTFDLVDHYPTASTPPATAAPGGPRQEWHLTLRAEGGTPHGPPQRFQVLTVSHIAPTSATQARTPAHLAVTRWGDVVTLRWQRWEGRQQRFAGLHFEVPAARVDFEESDSPNHEPDEKLIEAGAVPSAAAYVEMAGRGGARHSSQF